MNAELVWNNLNDQLVHFIRVRVPDKATADDLLQEVYVRVQTGILRDEDKLHAWVYQIARNVIIDYYRRSEPFDGLPAGVDPDDVIDLLPAPEDDADAEFRVRLASSVRQMITLLPDEYREALILTEMQGMTQKALAAHLGISLPAAKSRVQRAKKMLRELFLLCCELHFDRQGTVIDYTPRCGCAVDDC
ncbi:MAG: RNA polymerase sigma factor SigZ [Anaerolinea sp.]|nr:RNA polymerase sigma factor SigZ [Anaerolinea sp.]